jgi:hypothetical protein
VRFFDDFLIILKTISVFDMLCYNITY